MIREANKTDAMGVAAVLKESYNIESLDEGKEVFLNELNKGYIYLVSEEDKEIAGLTTWYVHGLPKHGLCELDRIAVLPKFQGRGIARSLFDGLIKSAKEFYESKNSNLRKLYLLTHESNSGAHNFYEKMGLKHEVTLIKHYYNKEDERVYSMFF